MLYVSDFLEPYFKFVISKAGENYLLGAVYVYETTDGIWKKWRISEVVSRNRIQQIIMELKDLLSVFR